MIRRNVCHDNPGAGIQINADPQMGGDGITSQALIENNTLFHNGSAGGAAVNLASVRDSIIRNNLIYDNRAGGIAGWGDGNGPAWGCISNVFFNNTVVFREGEGRWCISLKEGSIHNIIMNNILSGGHGGALEFSRDSVTGLVCDYNCLYGLSDGFVATYEDEDYFTFEAWRGLGFGAASITARPSVLFTEWTEGCLDLKPGSPAIDAGTDAHPSIPGTDLNGNPRYDDPSMPNSSGGNGFTDMGCLEFRSGDPVPTPTPVPEPVVEIVLDMGGDMFEAGDTCYIDLICRNPVEEKTLDLYVILEYSGGYWFYPSWRELSEGIDFTETVIPVEVDYRLHIVPAFTVPAFGGAGPFGVYAAGFGPGTLDLSTMVTNLAHTGFSFI